MYKQVILNNSFVFAYLNFYIIALHLEMNYIWNISRILIRSAWFYHLYQSLCSHVYLVMYILYVIKLWPTLLKRVSLYCRKNPNQVQLADCTPDWRYIINTRWKKLMEDEDNTMKEIICKSNCSHRNTCSHVNRNQFSPARCWSHIYSTWKFNRFKKQIQLFADKLLQVIGII